MPEVECDNCGEITSKSQYKIDRNENLFCSQNCYHDFGRPDMEGEKNPNRSTGKIAVECEQCGDMFDVYPYREDSARFCSRECSDEYKKGITGEDHARWKGNKETYTCEQCGGRFEEYPYRNSRKYCSEGCYRKAAKYLFAGENNPVWRGGRVDNYGPNWQDQRMKVLERDGHTCQECGKHADDMERSPDIHHKKRLGWFKEEYDAPEWWGKGNRVANLVTLCMSCHLEKEWSENGAISD